MRNKIIVPQGFLGATDSDTVIDTVIRTISLATSNKLPDGNDDYYHEKYGINFENDIFMIHPYCWCEEDNCSWCMRCSCEMAYFIDDKEVDIQEWIDLHKNYTENKEYDSPEYNLASYEVDNRRKTKVAIQCDFCKNGKEKSPNFWYKLTDYKVWWYKYIGRSMEFNKEISIKEIQDIQKNCLESLK